MCYVMCYSKPSIELACHHTLRLIVAGVRRVQGARTRPAEIRVINWDNSISAAFNVTVASPLNSSTITSMYSGAAARAAELRKHTQNVLN